MSSQGQLLGGTLAPPSPGRLSGTLGDRPEVSGTLGDRPELPEPPPANCCGVKPSIFVDLVSAAKPLSGMHHLPLCCCMDTVPSTSKVWPLCLKFRWTVPVAFVPLTCAGPDTVALSWAFLGSCRPWLSVTDGAPLQARAFAALLS